MPETTTKPPHPPMATAEEYFDDYFVKTISKWLPDISPSATQTSMKKRRFIETLLGALPNENDAVPCNFLLRLLRLGSMFGVGPTHRAELERRSARRLDQAELRELLIPSFSHTCGTLLDVGLTTRLVKRFLLGGFEGASGSGAAAAKVAKLVDGYLAEAAVDSNLGLPEFVELAAAFAHPNLTKQETKLLCRLIDSRKLTSEASLHAFRNERLPARAVLQILFSEQTKLIARQLDYSDPFGIGPRSSNHPSPATTSGIDQRKREGNVQQMEIKRLKEDVMMLRSQCNAMQARIERLIAEKKKRFFKWRRLGLSFRGHGDRVVSNEVFEGECRIGAEFARGMAHFETRSDGKLGKGKGLPKG